MNLSELKDPFRLIYKHCRPQLKDKSSEDLIDIICEEDYEFPEDEDDIYAILVMRSWQALVNIFYKQQNTNLSVEDCYVIFLDALDYVIETRPWKKEDSSLYQDDTAFIKAMMQCAHSRKLNYITAQHRQKRVLNCNALSVDALNEDFQDGYFTKYYDSYVDTGQGSLYELVRNLFLDNNYLASFTLNAILNIDIFDVAEGINERRLRKYLRSIDDDECTYFSNFYKLSFNDVMKSLETFQNLSTNKLTKKIKECIMMLKHTTTVKEVLKC